MKYHYDIDVIDNKAYWKAYRDGEFITKGDAPSMNQAISDAQWHIDCHKKYGHISKMEVASHA